MFAPGSRHHLSSCPCSNVRFVPVIFHFSKCALVLQGENLSFSPRIEYTEPIKKTEHHPDVQNLEPDAKLDETGEFSL